MVPAGRLSQSTLSLSMFRRNLTEYMPNSCPVVLLIKFFILRSFISTTLTRRVIYREK